MSHLFDHLHDIIKKARGLGADSADAVAAVSLSSRAAVREGLLSDLERSETTELGLRVLIGKKQACLATTDLDPKGFAALAERAVGMCRMAPEDPYAGLPEERQYEKDFANLDLHDKQEIPASALIENAKTMDALARDHKAITNVEESSASTGNAGFAYVTSNGFSAGFDGSAHSLSIETIAGAGTHMVRDYAFSQAIHAVDLESAHDVANTAIIRTASRMNARKMPTCQAPVIFSSRVARGLVGNFLSSINGNAIARKSSFLIEALDSLVFNEAITIIDDPLLKRGLRSKPFDGEGVPVKKRTLVDKGRLTTWLLNCSAARQLGLETTGHASRAAAGVPGISAHNVMLQPGTVSANQLIKDIKQGFFVTETMGMGVNILTGDYSQGAAGFWIENGEIAFPVHEMTIAGNLASMFKIMLPANDLKLRYGIDSPTLRIEGMTIAGA